MSAAHPRIRLNLVKALEQHDIEVTDVLVQSVLVACHAETASAYQLFEEFEPRESGSLPEHLFDIADYLGLPMTNNPAIHRDRDLINIFDFINLVADAVRRSVVD